MSVLRRSSAFLLALTLLLAACGGGGGEPAGSEESESGSSTTATSQDSGSGGEETLSDFFGFGDDDQEAAEARFADQEATRQELIRACMAEQGFDYTPVMPPSESFQAFGPGDEEEFVKTQGFGITTWYGNEDAFDPGIEFEDPNQEMVDNMSDSERDAYFEALYGTEEEQMEGARTEVDPETGEEFTVVEGFGAGCEGQASQEVFGDQSDTQDLWEELGPAMEALQERIQADPRIAEFNEDWSACMAEAGFEFESQEEMYETVFEDFQARLDEIIGPGGGFSDPFAGWTDGEIEAFFEEKTQDEIDAFFEQAQEEAQADVDQQALEALQQEEIDLAVANFTCGSDFAEVYQEVAADYEPDFIAEHRETLERIRDAQGG